jgi:hypothetical protein
VRHAPLEYTATRHVRREQPRAPNRTLCHAHRAGPLSLQTRRPTHELLTPRRSATHALSKRRVSPRPRLATQECVPNLHPSR